MDIMISTEAAQESGIDRSTVAKVCRIGVTKANKGLHWDGKQYRRCWLFSEAIFHRWVKNQYRFAGRNGREGKRWSSEELMALSRRDVMLNRSAVSKRVAKSRYGL